VNPLLPTQKIIRASTIAAITTAAIARQRKKLCKILFPSPAAGGSGLSAGVQVVPYVEIALQGRVSVAPRAEVVELPPDLLRPHTVLVGE
jgi:hypothetical protein